MRKKIISVIFLSLFFLPIHLFAQNGIGPNPFDTPDQPFEITTGTGQGGSGASTGGSPTASKLIQEGIKILNLLVSFAIGLSLVVFLFALVKYITAGAGEDKAAARNLMIYGIIALFVSVSVWGLVKFIQGATGISGGEQVAPPSLPTY